MKVAVLGSGGREHALALKISESPSLSELFILPGNPGTKKLGHNIQIDINNFSSVINFCKTNSIDFVVVGPEQPLVNGIIDELKKNGIVAFGPSKNAARLEGEKSFAKQLMIENSIPTAAFNVFQKDNYSQAVEYLKSTKYPVVIKADGLAAGKGVVIVNSFNEAKKEISNYFDKSLFGKAGEKIIIEEFMEGEEVSVFAITDGVDYVLLPTAQDHKKIGEGDAGKNTGGMGAYSPTPFVSNAVLEQIKRSIIEPTLFAMQKVGSKFSGCLYCGLMLTSDGPKVVEFNSRFGDPETQVVLPLIEGDFLKLLYSSSTGKIDKDSVKFSNGACVGVVLASKGYPEHYEKGYKIYGLDQDFDNDVIIFHAGTKESNGEIITNGGRVLNVIVKSKNNDLTYCKKRCYEVIQTIYFDGMYYRKDISDKAFKH
ncbi:phosphoribosylamine--glycine ligase [Melioribacteraceae bacterium 4301-Me]|uniref:phosphoribosylamine--glycine ligase n=1 Tax=Pyranulibacter aquaticus TaxID=3163344 RepID=UPI0035976C26